MHFKELLLEVQLLTTSEIKAIKIIKGIVPGLKFLAKEDVNEATKLFHFSMDSKSVKIGLEQVNGDIELKEYSKYTSEKDNILTRNISFLEEHQELFGEALASSLELNERTMNNMIVTKNKEEYIITNSNFNGDEAFRFKAKDSLKDVNQILSSNGKMFRLKEKNGKIVVIRK